MDYEVFKSKDGTYGVRRKGAKKASRSGLSRNEAIACAKELSKRYGVKYAVVV
jgi:hypothetical protein